MTEKIEISNTRESDFKFQKSQWKKYYARYGPMVRCHGDLKLLLVYDPSRYLKLTNILVVCLGKTRNTIGSSSCNPRALSTEN